MKMSNDLYNDLKNETVKLSKNADLKTLKCKMIEAGNSETRFAFDIFYMIQAWNKFGQKLTSENLNDNHIQTAMLKIVKEVIC